MLFEKPRAVSSRPLLYILLFLTACRMHARYTDLRHREAVLPPRVSWLETRRVHTVPTISSPELRS